VREHLKTRANQLTALRLLLVPLLWVLAVLGLPRYVGIGLIVSAVSDILDGVVARRSDQTSAFGSRFDSMTDMVTAVSAIAWTAMVAPDVVEDHPLLLLGASALALASPVVGWIRFRRFADLHLHSARAAGVVGYAFVIHAFLVGPYLEPLFYLGVALAIVASLEALWLQLTVADVAQPIGSVIVVGQKASDQL
jgi:hypothetical protein